MFTNRRLDEAFENAHRISFGEKDRFIIFSDCHRGDNSISDEFAHNQNLLLHALDYYWEHGYTLIENGDGDELWEHARFHHIRYAHGDIYEQLQQYYFSNRYVMIYGNHNIQFRDEEQVRLKLHNYIDEFTGKKTPLFPNIKVHPSVIMTYEPTGQELYVVHGHQGDLPNDQLWQVSKLWMRYFWRYMHIIGFKNPASPAKNIHRQHKIERKFVRWIKESHHMLLVGHTHRPKFSKPGQIPYFNSGCCVRPRNITGLEIADGAISLIEWRIWPDAAGRLQVVRRVLRGPELLKNYLSITRYEDEEESEELDESGE